MPYGIGANYQHRVQWMDGIYKGFTVKSVAGAGNELNVTVSQGLAIVGEQRLERGAADNATNVAAPNTLGAHTVYLNAPNAKDANGAAIAQVTIAAAEAAKTRTNIYGTPTKLHGRSLVLARLTVAAHSGTVTLAGTFAAAETVTVTVDGTAVVTTLDATSAASPSAAATAVRNALAADATVAGKVDVTVSNAVVTITSKLAVTYSLAVSETSVSGTATASGAALSGGGVTAVDNTVQINPLHFPGQRMDSVQNF